MGLRQRIGVAKLADTPVTCNYSKSGMNNDDDD